MQAKLSPVSFSRQQQIFLVFLRGTVTKHRCIGRAPGQGAPCLLPLPTGNAGKDAQSNLMIIFVPVVGDF